MYVYIIWKLVSISSGLDSHNASEEETFYLSGFFISVILSYLSIVFNGLHSGFIESNILMQHSCMFIRFLACQVDKFN